MSVKVLVILVSLSLSCSYLYAKDIKKNVHHYENMNFELTPLPLQPHCTWAKCEMKFFNLKNEVIDTKNDRIFLQNSRIGFFDNGQPHTATALYPNGFQSDDNCLVVNKETLYPARNFSMRFDHGTDSSFQSRAWKMHFPLFELISEDKKDNLAFMASKEFLGEEIHILSSFANIEYRTGDCHYVMGSVVNSDKYESITVSGNRFKVKLKKQIDIDLGVNGVVSVYDRLSAWNSRTVNKVRLAKTSKLKTISGKSVKIKKGKEIELDDNGFVIGINVLDRWTGQIDFLDRFDDNRN